jgi:hypothetical protein
MRQKVSFRTFFRLLGWVGSELAKKVQAILSNLVHQQQGFKDCTNDQY